LAGAPIRSVSEITRDLKRVLNEGFDDVWVRGEISGFKRHAPSGHLYFHLKDEGAVLSCAMWRALAAELRFAPADGIEVEARGTIDVYPRTGRYQLLVRELLPAGRGALLLAREALRRRLAGEGLFEPSRKRPLPAYPRRVALLTSPSGAAARDFLHVIGRRWPLAEVVLVAVPVQGEGAAERIAKRLAFLGRWDWPEVVALVRGGGSLEDLWAFNEEAVVRAVAASPHPVVTGIGHEVDRTLADEAADLAAPTPSAAAERLAPERGDVLRRIGHLAARGRHAVVAALERWRARFERARAHYALRRAGDVLLAHEQARMLLAARLARAAARAVAERASRVRALRAAYGLRRPGDLLARWRERVQGRGHRLAGAMTARLAEHRRPLGELAGRLRALSPRAVLARGYALARRPDGKLVRQAQELVPGDPLLVEFTRGAARTRVEEILGGAGPRGD
jgi:exodeoxyribonuclease VII large subunit